MSEEQPKNPLHGITLKAIVEELVQRHGWDGLGQRLAFRCFTRDPSLKSSLKFLRKNEWARGQVEDLYLEDQRIAERNAKRNRRRAAQRAFRKAGESGAGEAGPSGEEE
jgi:uncharacterized protein (DUF2132 family)